MYQVWAGISTTSCFPISERMNLHIFLIYSKAECVAYSHITLVSSFSPPGSHQLCSLYIILYLSFLIMYSSSGLSTDVFPIKRRYIYRYTLFITDQNWEISKVQNNHLQKAFIHSALGCRGASGLNILSINLHYFN